MQETLGSTPCSNPKRMWKRCEVFSSNIRPNHAFVIKRIVRECVQIGISENKGGAVPTKGIHLLIIRRKIVVAQQTIMKIVRVV